MTPERQRFNEEILPEFIRAYVRAGNRVVDVGKPDDGWGYREMFQEMDYKTLDRDEGLNPDICFDMEGMQWPGLPYDIMICYGVTEQCDNPFLLMKGLAHILKPGGYGLIGIMSVGFPMVQNLEGDLARFTPEGAYRLLKVFDIVDVEIAERDGVPSQIYAIVKGCRGMVWI